MTDDTIQIAVWDHDYGGYVMTSGHRVTLPKGTKIKGNKVLPAQQRLAAGQAKNQAHKASRLAAAWRAKGK